MVGRVWQQYGELVELRAAAMNREERIDFQQRIADLERLNRDSQEQLAAWRGAEGVSSNTAQTANAG